MLGHQGEGLRLHPTSDFTLFCFQRSQDIWFPGQPPLTLRLGYIPSLCGMISEIPLTVWPLAGPPEGPSLCTLVSLSLPRGMKLVLVAKSLREFSRMVNKVSQVTELLCKKDAEILLR